MPPAFDRCRHQLRRYRPRVPVAAGIGAIVGFGMAAFAFPLDQSPLFLGLVAGIGAFFLTLHYG